MMESNMSSSSIPSNRPLSALRQEYWMIQKLGCGGFGKGRTVYNVQLTIAWKKNYNHARKAMQEDWDEFVKRQLEIILRRKELISIIVSVYLIRNRESRNYCAAKHQRWHTPDVPRLTRREVIVLKKLIHKNVRQFFWMSYSSVQCGREFAKRESILFKL